MKRRAAIVAMAFWAVVGTAAAARAGDGDGAPPAFHLSVELDVPLVLVGGGIASSYFLMSESAPPPCAPLCNRSNVNVFDRWAAGYYSRPWQTVGDLATASTIIIVPLALFAAEDVRHGFGDLLVVAEAALLTAAIQVPASYAVGRPRPRVYGESAPLDERNDANAGRSFFSGHVANCVAATLATRTALARLHHPRLAWAAFAVGMAGSALVGVARVAAGSHFPTDVAVGVAVGAGVGIAVPALHEARIGVAPMAAADGQGIARGLALGGVF